MIKLSSPLAIVSISIASLVGAYLFLKGGEKAIKHKFGVAPKTLLDTLTNPGRFDTIKNIQSSSSKSLSNNSAIFGSNKSSSKGGGSKRRCKKGGKRKTKGRK